jgi:hypothetical protein
LLSVEQGYSFDLERLDAILVGSIFPQCFLCGEYFLLNDLCVSIKVPDQLTLRFHRDKGEGGSCWEYFILGVNLFAEQEHKLIPQYEIVQ